MFNAMMADMAERTERNTSETAFAAGQLVEKVAALEKQLEETKRELALAREETARYKAEQMQKERDADAEHAAETKKMTVRSWLQILVSVLLAFLLDCIRG